MVVNLGKFCYCALAILAIPFQTQPCLESIAALTEKFKNYYKENYYLPLNNEDEKPTSFVLFNIVDTLMLTKEGSTTMLLFITYSLAYFAIRLDFVLALVGATGGMITSFLLPTLVYWKLFPEDEFRGTRIIALVMTIVGLLSGVFYILSLVLR